MIGRKVSKTLIVWTVESGGRLGRLRRGSLRLFGLSNRITPRETGDEGDRHSSLTKRFSGRMRAQYIPIQSVGFVTALFLETCQNGITEQ